MVWSNESPKHILDQCELRDDILLRSVGSSIFRFHGLVDAISHANSLTGMEELELRYCYNILLNFYDIQIV